jgi:hypothetical protein
MQELRQQGWASSKININAQSYFSLDFKIRISNMFKW